MQGFRGEGLRSCGPFVSFGMLLGLQQDHVEIHDVIDNF